MIKEQGQGQIWLCLFLFMSPPKKQISLRIQSGVGGSNPSEGFKLKINLFPLIF
jgi:hypothetical protein